MFASGHLGAAYLVHRATGLRLRPLLGAALWPDLVDKGLQYGDFFISGRHLAHNLFALLLTAAIAYAIWGVKVSISWILGYVLHLLGDLPFSWHMPWFFPFAFGAWENSVETGFLNMAPGQLALDAMVASGGLALFIRDACKQRATRR